MHYSNLFFVTRLLLVSQAFHQTYFRSFVIEGKQTNSQVPRRTHVAMTEDDSISYIGASVAKAIDDYLMTAPGFSLDQLMELAGYSVAVAAHSFVDINISSSTKSVLLLCGPGNNGGDGLVAARHLKHFGFDPVIVYPKQSKGQLFENLVKQCTDLEISIHDQLSSVLSAEFIGDSEQYLLIVDALFGFSFTGPARPPFTDMISFMKTSNIPILSVDIPSGWHVELGDIHETGFVPEALISLTVPKKCMYGYQGVHFVGGRYVNTLNYSSDKHYSYRRILPSLQ